LANQRRAGKKPLHKGEKGSTSEKGGLRTEKRMSLRRVLSSPISLSGGGGSTTLEAEQEGLSGFASYENLREGHSEGILVKY